MKAAQDIILTPVITERSVDDMAESKYTFKVAKDANKVEIAKAAEAGGADACLLYTSPSPRDTR